MDDVDREREEVLETNRLIGEAERSLESLLESCPEPHQARFLAKIQEWAENQ